ncbi:hypothetical protein Tco_0899203 [Tanacetum coccineum]
MGTCAPFAIKEGFTPLTKTPREILAMDNANFPPPPPMVGTPKKQNMNKFCDYHQDRVKDIRQGGQKSKGSTKGKEKVINMASGSEEHMLMAVALQRLCTSIASEILAIDEESAGEPEQSKWNLRWSRVHPHKMLLLGRTGMRSLGVVASTSHSMIKFPTSNGIATISTTRETLRECRQIEEAQDLSRHARRTGKEPMQLDDMEGRRQPDKGRKLPKSGTEEKIVEQIWVNLEAYVGDMVIKSRTEQDIIKDIKQTFSTLRRINMKLNPKKCSFGIEEGKFLGYIVTSEGIRANPKKLKAVMDMPSPKTLKQMQSLSRKLAALNCFLSKSDERSLPFLDTLKKCTNKKDFRWTEAAKAAFLEMKKLVSELPTLTTPKKGETLMMDARELIRACDDCQAHASVPRLPKADMISVTSAWPFMK